MVQVFPETETPKDVHVTARHKPKWFLKQNDRNPFSVSLCPPQMMLGVGVCPGFRAPETGKAERGPSQAGGPGWGAVPASASVSYVLTQSPEFRILLPSVLPFCA